MSDTLPNSSPDGLRRLLRQLATCAPPVHVFGGVAEDALLDGRLTRPHTDVDVVIRRDDLPHRLAEFAAFGYVDWRVMLEEIPGRPMVINATYESAMLEIGIVDRDEDGPEFFELDGPGGEGRYRIVLPADAFTSPPATIDDIPVHVVSPLAAYQIRIGLIRIGSFGPPRPKDLAVHPRLVERFFRAVKDADIEPTVERVA